MESDSAAFSAYLLTVVKKARSSRLKSRMNVWLRSLSLILGLNLKNLPFMWGCELEIAFAPTRIL
jgi:hypothetical protein